MIFLTTDQIQCDLPFSPINFALHSKYLVGNAEHEFGIQDQYIHRTWLKFRSSKFSIQLSALTIPLNVE